MGKAQVTADEVLQAILHRITTGQYEQGSRLPSVRDLAAELGSNRNTVNKAYQALLDLGVIDASSSGRKGFIIRNPALSNSKSRGELVNYFYRQSVNLIWQSMAAGVTMDEIQTCLTEAVHTVYGQSRIRLVFLECNEHDSVEMGHNLYTALGLPVENDVLDNFYNNLTAMLRSYDLIVTTFHHMAEVREAVLNAGGPINKVVGIDTRLTPESMVGIARLPNPRIGIITTLLATSEMLKHILYSYHPDWEIDTAAIDDQGAVRLLAQQKDHVIVTHTCSPDFTSLTGRPPDVIVNFQIDEQSISFLKQRIYDVQRGKSTPIEPSSLQIA